MRRPLAIAAIILAALLAVLVSAMNPARTEIELAFGRIVSPVGLALVIAFAIGLLLGLLTRSFWVTELLNERGRLRRALRLAEASARSSAVAGEQRK